MDSKAAKKLQTLTTLSPVPISMADNTIEAESITNDDLFNSTGSIDIERDFSLASSVNASAVSGSHTHGYKIGDGRNIGWCSGCRIGEPTIIIGSNGGKYTVWNIELETLRGSSIFIKRRYSDFEQLRATLKANYTSITNIPRLPPKTYFLTNRFDPAVLEERRKGLEFFLSNVLLNPILCNRKEVMEFVSPKKI